MSDQSVTRTVGFSYDGKPVVLQLCDDVIWREMMDAGHVGFYEWQMLNFIQKNITGGTMVDAGANFGNHAVFMAMFCRANIVHAFEPVKENYDHLVYNKNVNKIYNMHTHHCGLSDSNKTMFYNLDDEKRWSQVSLESAGANKISVIYLDFMEITNLTLLKIDVEGMERKVIKGAIATISKCRPEIFIEIWDAAEKQEIEKMIFPFGYKLIERYNHAPTYHYSASNKFPVTYKP